MINNNQNQSFAEVWPEMYNIQSRRNKAKRILKILKDYLGSFSCMQQMTLLDLGCSTGIMDDFFAIKFKKVVGIDNDNQAVWFAKKNFIRPNLHFYIQDILNTKFRNNSFDIIICSHIYEHIDNPQKMFEEIYRILKPKGICYLAAINKLWPIEPHYKLPVLSWLPKKLANYYVSIFGKAKNYYENPQTYFGLKKLTVNFYCLEYTQKILQNPRKYGFEDIIPPGSLWHILAWLCSPLAKYLSPTFFWLLLKK